jgi:hypothetical protein
VIFGDGNRADVGKTGAWLRLGTQTRKNDFKTPGKLCLSHEGTEKAERSREEGKSRRVQQDIVLMGCMVR